MGERYYEVDAVRGTALLLMVLYHTLFCLSLFRIITWFDPQVISGAAGAAVFIFIAGLSLILAGRRPAGVVRRGVQLLLLGLIITAVTAVVYPQGCVVFGILHLIGCGTILSIPFLSETVKWYVPAAAGLGIIILSCFLQGISGNLLLLPFGMPYPGFTSIDYEPLIPWFGVMLLGISAGKILYPSGKRGALASRIPPMPAALSPLCFVGRHTLLIYMLHIPVIILLIFLIFPDAVFAFLF